MKKEMCNLGSRKGNNREKCNFPFFLLHFFLHPPQKAILRVTYERFAWISLCAPLEYQLLGKQRAKERSGK